MYFPNLHGTHLCFSPSKALCGVSLKYAFKLMQDLITHLHSAQILSLPLSLHLLSLLIFFFLPLFPTASLNPPSPPHSPRPHAHLSSPPSVVLCLIYSACFKALIIYLKLWSALKGRNRRRARGEGFFWRPETLRPSPYSPSPSIHLLFCLSLPSLRPQFVLHQ